MYDHRDRGHDPCAAFPDACFHRDIGPYGYGYTHTSPYATALLARPATSGLSSPSPHHTIIPRHRPASPSPHHRVQPARPHLVRRVVGRGHASLSTNADTRHSKLVRGMGCLRVHACLPPGPRTSGALSFPVSAARRVRGGGGVAVRHLAPTLGLARRRIPPGSRGPGTPWRPQQGVRLPLGITQETPSLLWG